jgi:hypothetical protein
MGESPTIQKKPALGRCPKGPLRTSAGFWPVVKTVDLKLVLQLLAA